MSNFLAPFVFLPASVAAGYFILGHFAISGTQSRLDEICSYAAGEITSKFLLPYTSSQTVNERLCSVVEIFHGGGMESTPNASLFMNSFALWFAPICFFIIVEAARPHQGVPLRSSMLFGILYQVATAGAITSFYWMLFVPFSRYHTTRPKPQDKGGAHTKAHAEAITFAFLAGAVIPTIALMKMQDPYVTVLWQPFPIYISIFYHLHLFIRPPSQHATSGFPILQAMYITMFVLSSSFHVATIWPHFGDWETLKAAFVPSIQPVPEVTTSVDESALHLLQYDAIFSCGSSMVATLWFASDFAQALRLVLWYLVAVPVVGPGSALLAVFLWRESNLAPAEEAPLKKVQ